MTPAKTPRRVAAARPRSLPGIRFATFLGTLAGEIRATRSGERSRLKLFAAAARLLETVGYRDLQVENISADAELAKGTFYVYFDSKEEFLRELLQRYVDFEIQTYPAPTSTETTFGGVRRVVSWYAQTFESNVGLLRCMLQMAPTDDVVHATWQRRNEIVVERAVTDFVRTTGRRPRDPEMTRLAVRTVGGMLDQSLFTRYGLQASPGAELQQVDYDTLVELLSVLLYRAMHAEDPPQAEVTRVRSLLTQRD
jgi:TetR/AcrR family transcriptional regulator, transcriptional repressor for nem operon